MVSYVNTKAPQDHKKGSQTDFVSQVATNSIPNSIWNTQNVVMLSSLPNKTLSHAETLRNEDFIPSAYSLLQSLQKANDARSSDQTSAVSSISSGSSSVVAEYQQTATRAEASWEAAKQKASSCKAESDSSLPSGHERVPKQTLSSGNSFLQFLEVLETDGVVVRHFGKVPSRLKGICGWTVKDHMMDEWHRRRREWFMAGKEGKIYKPNSLYQILRRLGFFPTEGTKRASHGLDFEGSRTFWWDEGLRNKYTHRRSCHANTQAVKLEESPSESEQSSSNSPRAGQDSPDMSSMSSDLTAVQGPAGHPADVLGGSSVSVDSKGNIFILDLCSHGVRKITPRGVVSVLANRISPLPNFLLGEQEQDRRMKTMLQDAVQIYAEDKDQSHVEMTLKMKIRENWSKR
ncbi:hypothetical protein GUITHDRAFT_153494 [Guillardia theta CCMP2712]|uniref:Uncharacterized protein n=1 Tax=Guillardia theta (strain CCMP2712) TaxID=905079 RepID=L1J3F3_GUITC|nr:hypothetical protein GUITHDRAFT_153494 [Guillardia theta CCMP2712]EKX42625.1 hypothetical protein GUITHDRAFT_153494 [Guillardia theta CCMP2712]|eukprot:XP_005829605.1 hypothetical protein GUITHDRAFT_153494 [Guillardia theta CCMP2712]